MEIINKLIKRFKGKGYYNTWIGQFVYKHFFLPNKPEIVETTDGFKIHIYKTGDLLSDTIAIDKVWEAEEGKVMKENIKEGDVVLDIGANIGYFTILMSKLVGKTGKVYAFEPDQENVDLINKNLKLNNCKNVIIIQKVICNKVGKVKLYLRGRVGEHCGYTIFKNDIERFREVDCTTLDNEIDFKVDFIKVDVEGAELEVLKGAKETLKSSDKLLLEFMPMRIKERDTFNPDELLNLLKESEFNIEKINNVNLFCKKRI